MIPNHCQNCGADWRKGIRRPFSSRHFGERCPVDKTIFCQERAGCKDCEIARSRGNNALL